MGATKWTAADCATLRKLAAEGKTITAAAAHFGVGRGAIAGKADRLGVVFGGGKNRRSRAQSFSTPYQSVSGRKAFERALARMDAPIPEEWRGK